MTNESIDIDHQLFEYELNSKEFLRKCQQYSYLWLINDLIRLELMNKIDKV